MNKKLIEAIGGVNAKRVALKSELGKARKVLYAAMESLEGEKTVELVPEGFWAEKIAEGKASLDDAVMDESVGITWRKDDDVPGEGFIRKVAVGSDGVIEITAIPVEEGEDVVFTDTDTNDIEKILEFIDNFADVKI